jgi:hypothetical protein
MDLLLLRNFRCFTTPGDIPIRPLTLLVGENSSGKTSFLAAIRLAWDIAYSAKPIDFNEEPLLLGAFDQIANYRGGRAGRAESFEIGFEAPRRRHVRQVDHTSGHPPLRYSAEFRRSGSHPVIAKQTLQSGDYRLTITFPTVSAPPHYEIQASSRKITGELDPDLVRFRITADAPVDWAHLLYSVIPPHQSRADRAKPKFDKDQLIEIEHLLRAGRFRSVSRPIAISPVRTRPLRTYNPVSAAPLPEGDHIPMVLAKTFFEERDNWLKLKSALDAFGSASGLFSSLEIKPLGRHESDPFQIRVKIEGPPSNLVDVGYGVSQVLPILVDALLASRDEFFLLQQPEIHLHPRAQAELGSFLGTVVSNQSMRAVVETHSDYLLDRIRMDIRDKKGLSPDDVIILFFERNGLEVSVRSMEIDEHGNLLNAPPSYRRFFLEEERRFLGGS